ncbi:hypothetical protein LuPra_01719 [Luteitalea pratensis]|uniref:Uncharacterized protein n=1 Tax=Luteitalea pratensis TaxID=1855912 RepID=A0A143PKA8_LUTPR|nr:hypothetical protein LuPra_01719 [Luteitalea pratensis]
MVFADIHSGSVEFRTQSRGAIVLGRSAQG